RVPLVASRLGKTIMIENFKYIAREQPIDIQIEPEIHMVHVSHVGFTWMHVTTHGHARCNHSIAIKFPAMHILIPTALKLCGDDEPCWIEIIGWFHRGPNCVGIDGCNEGTRILPRCHAVRRRMLQGSEGSSTAMRV